MNRDDRFKLTRIIMKSHNSFTEQGLANSDYLGPYCSRPAIVKQRNEREDNSIYLMVHDRYFTDPRYFKPLDVNNDDGSCREFAGRLIFLYGNNVYSVDYEDDTFIKDCVWLYPNSNFILIEEHNNDIYVRYKYGEKEYVDPNRFSKTKSAMNTQITLPKMPEYTPPSSPTPPPVYSLFNHPPIPEYPQFPEDWDAICSDDDHEYDSDCDCEYCCEEELERREETEDEPTGGGNCYYYYHSTCRCLACMCCGSENNEILRLCDQKLLTDDEKERNYNIYCNAYYEPAFDIWLCHGCGEVHEYKGKPRLCYEKSKEDYCEPALINKVECIFGNCIHCGSEYANKICKIQDKTKCECDKCMSLYSRFRNNKTKSARK